MMERKTLRDLIAFWIFGLANNFAYVIMLSAAEDIIHSQTSSSHAHGTNKSSSSSASEELCKETLPKPRCDVLSTGAILLADIIPALIIKLVCPFFMDRVPFGLRHFVVCSLQALSYIIVAFSTSFPMSLIGVIFASASSGFGENCLLALSSYYTRPTIAAWSSGTGGAGLVGSLAYAALTEPKIFGFSPRNALLSMLIVPIIFAIAFWFILTPSPNVHRMEILRPSTWIVTAEKKRIRPSKLSESDQSPHKIPPSEIRQEKDQTKMETFSSEMKNGHERRPSSSPSSTISTQQLTFCAKFMLIGPLLPLMIPMGLVYFAEYLINSGLNQLIHFDCSHGFGLSLGSQFRWYQTLYQLGVFASRSSVTWLELPSCMLYLLAVLQFANVAIFFCQALWHFIPHVGIVFALIVVEGLYGGASYVNTFNKIHKKAPEEIREFSLSIVASSDSIGIAVAGFLSILVHNFICRLYESIYP